MKFLDLSRAKAKMVMEQYVSMSVCQSCRSSCSCSCGGKGNTCSSRCKCIDMDLGTADVKDVYMHR